MIGQPIPVAGRGGNHIEGVVMEGQIECVAHDGARMHGHPFGLKLDTDGAEPQCVDTSCASERIEQCDTIWNDALAITARIESLNLAG